MRSQVEGPASDSYTSRMVVVLLGHAVADALIAEYFSDNVLRQDYLMTRAVKN